MKSFSMFQKKMMVLATVTFVALAAAGTVWAESTIDVTYDGYVAMGGMVTNTTNSYLLPGNPDSLPESGMETFGYTFLKVDAADLPTLPVPKAYLQLDVIALQDGMSWLAEGIADLGAFAVSADVAGINAGTASAFRNSIATVATDAISVTESGLISFDITDIVNEWIVSGQNFGLVLANSGGLMPRLHSTSTVTGLAPTINVVPEPATLGLMTVGIVGLLSRRKRN